MHSYVTVKTKENNSKCFSFCNKIKKKNKKKKKIILFLILFLIACVFIYFLFFFCIFLFSNLIGSMCLKFMSN